MRKGTKSKNRRMTLGPVSDTRVNKVSDFASTLRNSAGPTLNLRQKKRASLSRQSANRRKSKGNITFIAFWRRKTWRR